MRDGGFRLCRRRPDSIVTEGRGRAAVPSQWSLPGVSPGLCTCAQAGCSQPEPWGPGCSGWSCPDFQDISPHRDTAWQQHGCTLSTCVCTKVYIQVQEHTHGTCLRAELQIQRRGKRAERGRHAGFSPDSATHQLHTAWGATCLTRKPVLLTEAACGNQP